MACTQPTYVFAMLLTLIASNGILFIEGRQPKSKGTKEKLYSTEDQKEAGMHGSQAIGSLQNPEGNDQGYDLPAPPASHVPQNLGFKESVAGQKDDFRPTKPGNSPGIGHSTQTLGFDESVAGYKDDFRPTTPGSSPGVGHSFARKKNEVQSDTKSKGTGVSHSMGGNENDFRPTGPSHSPGVGHAFQTTNPQRNP